MRLGGATLQIRDLRIWHFGGTAGGLCKQRVQRAPRPSLPPASRCGSRPGTCTTQRTRRLPQSPAHPHPSGVRGRRHRITAEGRQGPFGRRRSPRATPSPIGGISLVWVCPKGVSGCRFRPNWARTTLSFTYLAQHHYSIWVTMKRGEAAPAGGTPSGRARGPGGRDSSRDLGRKPVRP